MKMKDVSVFKMNVELILIGPDGEIKLVRHGKNMVVTTGLYHIADQLSSSPGGAGMSHMAIGSGTAATSAATTTLQTELGRVSLTSRTDSGAVVTYIATFGAGTGTGAITEAGILNAASNGTLLCRLVFDVINKGSLDALQITWTLTAADDGVGV